MAPWMAGSMPLRSPGPHLAAQPPLEVSLVSSTRSFCVMATLPSSCAVDCWLDYTQLKAPGA